MFQQQVRIINSFLMALDAICIILGGYCAYYFSTFINGGFKIEIVVFTGSILIIMIVNNYAMARLNLYGDKKPSSFFGLVWPVFKAIIIDFAFLSTAIVMFKQITYSRAFLIEFAGFSFLFIILQRIISHAYLIRKSKNGFGIHSILIVGSQERAKIVSDILDSQLSWGHKVIGRLSLWPEACSLHDCIGTVDTLPRILRSAQIDEVVFAINGNKSIDLSDHLNTCRKMGIPVRILPALWKKNDPNVSFEHCQSVPFITIKTDNLNATGLLYKRILDIFGGLVGTVIFLLLYPVIALAIKLDSQGPVLFKQKRVGQHGRLFVLYKFRSMAQDAEQQKAQLVKQNHMNGAMFKLLDDPRITRVGNFLRKYSLDEIPQFLNVLKGEMSLVGTRPPTPDEITDYMPEHLRRISAKPGITGLWQVSGRNEIKDFEKVVELDCKYLDNWRFSDDLKILARTFLVVLKRKGAF